MGKYLDILARKAAEEAGQAEQRPTGTVSAIGAKGDIGGCASKADNDQQHTFGRICRFGRTLSVLEKRCPDRVGFDRWRMAIMDGRRFLTQWGVQAEALGWTGRELFGLHEIPANPSPTYQRLSRYDCTGLIWLLQGCPVVALTAATAAIMMPTGSELKYRKLNKPALGPLGDSVEDFVP
jgi:hypothetical protein